MDTDIETAMPIRRAGCGREEVFACKNFVPMFFLWYLLIGLLSGWIANMIVRGGGAGLLVNLIVGLIGGLLGGWIFSWFGIIAVGTIGSILTSVAGAVILLWIAALIRPDKGH